MNVTASETRTFVPNSAFTAALYFMVDAAPESFPFCHFMRTELDRLDDLAAPNFLLELHAPQHYNIFKLKERTEKYL